MGPENSGQFFDLLPVILIILGIGIVAIVGWLVWIFTRPGGRRSMGQTLPDQDLVDQNRVGQSAAEPEQPKPPAHVLAMNHGTDGWEIYVRGQRYASLDSVPDAQTQAEVVDAIRHLARFAQDYIQRQRGGGTAAAPAGRAPGEPPVTAPARTPSSVAVPRAAASRPEVDPFGRRTVPSPALTPSINLADEIGEIVKAMVAATPSLQGHAVTLSSAAGGGVMFIVDGKFYQDLDQIPYPEVRELIRQATKEWERR